MSSTETRTVPSAPGLFAASLRTTSVGLLLIITLIAFEATAVAAALPTAARDLHGLAAYGWAFTGLFVASVIGMVVSGLISDRAGPRRPLVAGLVLFVVGLLVAGTAGTMVQLIAGRVVQGVATGLLITAAYVVIGQVYPEDLRPKVFAAISSAWVLPALFGPVLAGALTQQVSWRAVFLGLAPFAVLGGLLLVPVLRGLQAADHGPQQTGPVRDARLVRVLVAALGVVALVAALGVVALEAAGQDPTLTRLPLALAGVVMLAWGLLRLLPPGWLQVRRGVAAPVVFRGLLAGAFGGVESIVPLSMGVQHGYPPTLAALPLTAAGLTWAAGSWWQGRVAGADPEGRQAVRLMRAGFAFMATGLGVSVLAVQPELPAVLMFVAWGIGGIGAGLGISTASVLLLRHTTDADRGRDSSALQLSDSLTSAITAGGAGVLVAAATRGALGHTAAFTIITAVLAVLAAAGVALAGRASNP